MNWVGKYSLKGVTVKTYVGCLFLFHPAADFLFASWI